MKKITLKWLEEKGACCAGKNWFLSQKQTEPIAVVKKLMAEDRFSWANWLLVRIFTRKQKIAYAIFSAEQVLAVYERRYPSDYRPRRAIECTKVWMKRSTPANREKMRNVAIAADKAANDAYAADAAAAYAADAAARATYTAAFRAYPAAASVAANYAVDAAYVDAYDAGGADAARKEMKKRIIDYGVSLLTKGK